MKVAFLLSGNFRNSELSVELFKNNFLKKYNVDTFIHYGYTNENQIEISEQNLINLYNPKKIIFSKYTDNVNDELKKITQYPKFGEVNPQNFLLMWYGIHSVNELKKKYENENNFKYDIVVRTRFDIKLQSEFLIKNGNNVINIPIGWDHRGGYNDLFAYGDSNSMNYYCELYHHIFNYLDTGMLVHPEKILKHHLQKSNIPIMRNYVNLFLRDMEVSKLEYSCQ